MLNKTLSSSGNPLGEDGLGVEISEEKKCSEVNAKFHSMILPIAQKQMKNCKQNLCLFSFLLMFTLHLNSES